MEIEQPIMKTLDANICRICLRNEQNTVGLFTAEKDSTEILKKIYVCFQLTLIYKEHFPSSICTTCMRDLNMAYNFRQNCETFEKRFILFQDTATETKVPTNQFSYMDRSKLDSKLKNDKCENISFDEGY